MNIFYVYQLRDPRQEMPFYIGKGKKGRAWSHLKENPSDNSFKAKKVRKLLKQGVTPLVEILHRNMGEADALAMEIKLIKEYGRLNNHTGILTNLTDGGEGVSGLIRPVGWVHPATRPEVAKKISQSKTGKPRPDMKLKYAAGIHPLMTIEAREKHKANIQKAMQDPQRRAKCAAMKGKKHSEETKHRMSITRKGKAIEGQSERMAASVQARGEACCLNCGYTAKATPNFYRRHMKNCVSPSRLSP